VVEKRLNHVFTGGGKSMRAVHIGLACRNEREADRFFRDFLGLVKQEPKSIPASITRPLFGLDSPLPIVNYIGDGLRIEAFFTSGPVDPAGRLSHVCLEVESVDALIDRAVSFGLTVTRVPKGDGRVVFIDDSDGHRFEIKQGA
jgi:catechol 2,3-dioxygenase-like lactoylglutathione lyase family enzyme